MQSKITIEVDFNDNYTPYLRIIAKGSDDVRDKLLNSFLQSLGYESTWCKIVCDGVGGPDQGAFWKIKAITPFQLEQECEILSEQARVSKANNEKFRDTSSIK